MKYLLSFVVAALVMHSAARADDLDLAAAESKFEEVCANCHGPTGKGMASFPKLAGRDADYLASRLKQYRAGEQVGPNTPLMKPHAADLTDSDIESLATYIAKTF